MAKLGSILFFILNVVSVAWADTTVTATVDRNQLRPGDTLTYSVSVDSQSSVGIENPRWPDLRGFDVINTWNGSEIQSVFENGRFTTKRRQSFNLQLQALEEGVFEIGPAEVVVDSQVFRTKPIQIEVLAGARQAPPPNNQQNPSFPGLPSDEEILGLDDMFNQMLQDRLKRFGLPGQQRPGMAADTTFFIDVEVDKKRVYEGEQVLATYYLYTRGRITEIDTLKYPTLVGFWKEDIELATRLNFKPVVINGLQYNRALLASYALFPIKPGQATVDPYRAKCTVLGVNPFGLSTPKVETKESEPVPIEVMPLPEDGRPANFSGAVGRFQLESKIENPNPKTNQPVNITLRFQGRGNGKIIEMPKLQFPQGLEVYDTKTESKFFKDGRSFKQFDILVIPRQAGPMEIPAFTVSMFDPQSKSYYEIESQKISMNVVPGDAADQVQSAPLAGVSGETRPRPQGPPPLLLTYDAGTKSGSPFLIWIPSYAFVLGFLLWRSRVELGWGRRRETLRRLVMRRVGRLHELSKTKEWRKAASTAINLVYFVLGELSGLGGGSQEVSKMMAKAPPSFRKEFQGQLEKLLQDLNLVAFAPEEALGALKEKGQIQKRLSEVEKLLLKAIEQDFDEAIEDLRA